MRVNNKVIIVTGAASGMGKAMVELFAKEGGKVVVADLNLDQANVVANEMKEHNGNATAMRVDVSKLDDIKHLIEETIKIYGSIDALVNNAGIMDGMQPVGDLSDELWDKIINVNAKSVMMASREVIPHFIKQGSGTILNIASVGGLHGGRAGAAYTASKHAVVGLTKSTAYMYQQQGIRTNAIAPGGIETNIGNTMRDVNEFGASRQMLGNQLMHRFGQPEEIAQVALFLISDEASFVNGIVMQVDGGWTSY